MLQDGKLDSMHETTHFCIEVNSQVVNLQCVIFQTLQMCTKFQFREGKKCQWLLDYPILLTPNYPQASLKNSVKTLQLIQFHEIYFHILHFTLLSLQKPDLVH